MRQGLAIAALVMAGVAPACNGQFRFDALDGSVPRRCASDSDCPLASLHCDPMSGACLECVSDSQCSGNAARRCDLALHVCVQCGTDADCPGGERCASKTCVATCPDDGGACPDEPEHCDPATDLCIACAVSADCAGLEGRSTCDVPSGRCVGCTGDSMCNRSLPRCDPTGTCVQCLESTDCPTGTPVCDPSDHTCIQNPAPTGS